MSSIRTWRPRPPVLPAWAVRTAALAYAAVLVVVTLAPIRWRSDLARYRNNWRPQLVPIWNMVVNLRDGDRVVATLAGAAGNVALFMPLGFLLPMLAPWFDRFWRTVAEWGAPVTPNGGRPPTSWHPSGWGPPPGDEPRQLPPPER
ncbi:MAG TPA: VanZ family protein [Actinomycetota bacterium]